MNYSRQLHNLRADLALYYGQDLISCSHLTATEARDFFECQPFENWKKGKEHENKSSGELLKGINNVIRGLGVIAKVLSLRR